MSVLLLLLLLPLNKRAVADPRRAGGGPECDANIYTVARQHDGGRADELVEDKA